MDITNYVSGVTVNITNQITPKSIPSSVVGQAFIDLATLAKSNIESGATLYAPISAVTTVSALQTSVSGNTATIASIQNSLSGYATGAQLNAVASFATQYNQVGVTTSGTINMASETGNNSGWGFNAPAMPAFDKFFFSIRSWDGTSLVNNVRVIIRDTSYSGATLLDTTVAVNAPSGVTVPVTILLNTPINSANPLWFEYMTDGRCGIYGNVNSGVTSTKYSTARNLTTEPLTEIGSGSKYGALVTFYKSVSISATLTSGVTANLASSGFVQATNGVIQGIVNPMVQYQHPRGNSEMLGNSVYQNTTGLGVAVYKQLPTNVIFNNVSIPFYGASDSQVAVRIYHSSTFSANPSSLNLLQEIDFSGGTFNTNSSAPATIPLGNYLSASAGEYLYFFVYTTSGTTVASMLEFNADALSAPFRDHTLFLASTHSTAPWTNVWATGGASHYQAAFELFSIDPQLSSIIGTGSTQTVILPRINLPSTIYGIVGIESSIYYDSIILSMDSGLNSPLNYKVEINGNIGFMDTRRWYAIPAVTDIGSQTLTVSVYDLHGNLADSKNVTFVVKAAKALTGTTKNFLDIGDSTTFAGLMTNTEAADFAALTGGTAPTFWGNHGTAPGKNEGIGGWTFGYFATSGATFYKFIISGVTTASVGSQYTNNGSTFRIEESNYSGGTGYIKCSLKGGTNSPTSGGTLTKQAGYAGDATINYSSWTLEPGNPLWNSTGQILDIANYRNNLGMGSAKFDLVNIQLGINDCNGSFKSEATLEAIIASAKTIANAFIADNASTKIVIHLTTICGNTNGGWAVLYGAGNSKQLYMNAIWRLRELMIAAFDNGAFNANVYVGQAGISIDRYFGYDLTAKSAGFRYATETENDHINAVHPSQEGYAQLGDARFCQMLGLLS